MALSVPRPNRRLKTWTWADWTVGNRRLEYGTLTLDARGHAHFECVTSATDLDGGEQWWAGFSLETREGARLHVEPARPGASMVRTQAGRRYRWSFDFTYEPSNFDKIGRVIQTTTR